MTRRTRDLVFPLLLIAIGVVVLLANTGVLSAGTLQRLGDLWPLILIFLGVQLVLNHTLSRPQARLAGLAVAAVIVVAALAFAIVVPAAGGGTQRLESSEPLSGMTAATLDLSYSGATIDVQSAALDGQLFTAQVDYPNGEQPPDVSVDRGASTLQISGGGPSVLHLFGRRSSRHILVTLANRIPWSVQVSGGAAAMTLHLANLSLTKVEISGGATRVELSLPRPKGTLAVNLSGGATDLIVQAPPVEWQLSVSGGLSSVDINGARSGAVGDLQHRSPGYNTASNRIAIDVSGGISHVQLRTG
ncbi:MAG: DUF5668 domain-containing protein [Candidatus Dormibacteraeota bacterium]|nr:DUF5668 domain-containing protein [Candidatus Dormibacteraeota bacterium]